MLIFRKTGLDNNRHVAFSQQLGQKLEINPFFYGRENDRIGDPFLWDVSKYVIYPSTERNNHSHKLRYFQAPFRGLIIVFASQSTVSIETGALCNQTLADGTTASEMHCGTR